MACAGRYTQAAEERARGPGTFLAPIAVVEGEMMEHRWGQRRETNQRVQLRTRTGTAGVGRVCDVSISGARLATALEVLLLAYVQLSVVTQHGKHKRHRAFEGQVVRRTADGFALEWRELAPAAVYALKERWQGVPREAIRQLASVFRATRLPSLAHHPHPRRFRRPSLASSRTDSVQPEDRGSGARDSGGEPARSRIER
ncbi:MAG: PilZ domain-containing protein [Steroidobacteraceae bacterium]